MPKVDEDQPCLRDRAAEGHHDMVAQPHSEEEGPVAEAEVVAAEMSSDEQPLGSLGRRFNRLSPFYIGLTAAAGVAVTYGIVRVLVAVSSMLVLIGVAFFLAAVMGAFVAAAIPRLPSRPGASFTRCRTTCSRRRTTRQPSAGSTTDSISNNGSPTESTVQADQRSTTWSAQAPRFSAPWPTP